MIHIDTLTKEQFVNVLILNKDFWDFYEPREKELLSLDFDLEQMKDDFESWLIENCDNQ